MNQTLGARASHAGRTSLKDEVEDDPGEPMDAPADRFCDIVMEGGVTSGIIYASAVVELARHYRFKNIGGSSIGAFAAALTAAAEYRRRHGSGEGFDALAKLPEKLAIEEEGRTLLERLFVPQQRTQRLFRIFIATLERSGPISRIVCGINAALRQYWRRCLLVGLILGGVVLIGPFLSASACWSWPPEPECYGRFIAWFTAALLTLGVSILAGLLIGIARDLGHGVVPNGFGLCRGWDDEATPDRLDLASFLHLSIQEVAGRAVHDAPLTFRDLWDAPGSPSQVLDFETHGEDAHSINLEVYSSNLAHSRPYRFPAHASDDMGRLFFRVEELECYFPKGIVQYLAAFALPYSRHGQSDPLAGDVRDGYLELPVADMPIVVAARLAMSFPFLLSAVPLHAINHRKHSIEKCWMSDGGLCSNFPIHLFDSFLPRWPTFGISLDSRDEGETRAFWLPEFHDEGRADTWDFGPEKSFSKLAGFVGSLWKTTWRWNDSTMMRMPGVRDRVVRIFLEPGEGGVNIRMSAEKIRKLGTRYGKPAARAFIRKFVSPGAAGWDEHRWVRLNCLLIALRDRIFNFRKTAALDRHALPILKQIVAARSTEILRHRPEAGPELWPSEKPLTAAQANELYALVKALGYLEDVFKSTGENKPYEAVPRPSLRMRHPT